MMPKKVICRPVRSAWRHGLFSATAAVLLTALAAHADLRFDAFLGYDEILPTQSWFPITCEIFNDGPSFNAVVELKAEDDAEGQVRRFALDLPTNTRKRITIPVFATARAWDINLLDERGRVRSTQRLEPREIMKQNTPLFVALSRSVAGLPVLPDTQTSPAQNRRYLVARMQTTLFPDNPLALEGMDTLYLNSEKAADLTVGQVNALMEWLQDGGHLIVGVEQLTDVNGTPWLRDLLPCSLNAMTNVNAYDALRSWAVAAVQDVKSHPVVQPQNYPGNPYLSVQTRRRQQGTNAPRTTPPPTMVAPPVSTATNSFDLTDDDLQLKETPLLVATGDLRDGTVTVGDWPAPVAVDGMRGRGRITVLTFSPEREPFLSWKNRAWFWSKLAGVPPSAYQQNTMYYSRGNSDSIFKAMIETKQVRKLPLGWLLALLAAYLLVIGPLDQYWLKKINRQMLTWITFPCYVVFFSALIYFIGSYLRAGELEWNELNLVDVLPDTDRAVLRGQTYVSIYSPNNARYRLAGSQKFAALRGECMANYLANPERGNAVIDQTGNNFQASAYVAVWTSQLLVSDWVEPSGPALDMSVRPSGDGWDVTVHNGLDHPLSDMKVVLWGRLRVLGDVAADQTKTFAVKSSGTNRLVRDMVTGYGPIFQQAAGAVNASFGNNARSISDVAEGTVAASFIGFLKSPSPDYNNFHGPASLDLSRFVEDRYAILLVWDRGHSPVNLNQFTPKRVHRDTLFRLVVPVKTS